MTFGYSEKEYKVGEVYFIKMIMENSNWDYVAIARLIEKLPMGGLEFEVINPIKIGRGYNKEKAKERNFTNPNEWFGLKPGSKSGIFRLKAGSTAEALFGGKS